MSRACIPALRCQSLRSTIRNWRKCQLSTRLFLLGGNRGEWSGAHGSELLNLFFVTSQIKHATPRLLVLSHKIERSTIFLQSIRSVLALYFSAWEVSKSDRMSSTASSTPSTEDFLDRPETRDEMMRDEMDPHGLSQPTHPPIPGVRRRPARFRGRFALRSGRRKASGTAVR
jgi:hypothetical protein